MHDDDPEDIGALLSLIAEMNALNVRVAALHELLHDHLGISEAQYAAALAKASAAAAVDPAGPPRTKH